jgi:hypothetical protein
LIVNGMGHDMPKGGLAGNYRGHLTTCNESIKNIMSEICRLKGKKRMGSIPARILLYSLLFCLFVPHLSFAGTRTFIKEYTYRASEDDSRTQAVSSLYER